MNKKQKKLLFRIIISFVFLIVTTLLPFDNTYKLMLYLVPYTIAGYDILRKSVSGIIQLQPFDENFLMASATIGAFILGEYTEGCAVMLFYQIGELFQSYAVSKSRKNIKNLMDICPDYANIEDENHNIIQTSPSNIETGSIIIVKPGEKIPIDGIIIEGTSTLDTSALTGESLPTDVKESDPVQSGCINMTGLLRIRTTKAFEESTASKILELIENAGSKKSKSENFISKFAKYYTPAVCISAVLLAFIPPLLQLLVSNNTEWSVWIYRALTFLVISCPCALVISIPLGFFAAIGGAGNAGILIKGSEYLETLSKVKYIVFDKTGTLTKGVFEVTEIHTNGVEEKKLLEYASHAEIYSNHPISSCIRKAYKKAVEPERVKNVKEISGMGVIAEIDNISVSVGNEKLMEKLNLKYEKCTHPGTAVHVATDGKYTGYILISDVIKPDSAEAIGLLKQNGIKKTVMLTGDNKTSGSLIAEKLNIDEVYAELLPADKLEIAEQLLKKCDKNEKLAFVGDGINDAPVLSRADIGISMGSIGSDAAIEASDIVLMDDNPLKIVKAIRISKKCMTIVYQNIYFAIATKIICLSLGAAGLANMWFAIFADVGVMVIAVLNAIRSLKGDKKYVQ